MEAAFIDSEYYIGLNPDGYLQNDCLSSLIRFSRYYADSVLVEANTTPVNHPKWHDPTEFDTRWVSGAAYLITKQIWNDIGGFDEELHMYCEDVDLSWRAKAAGYMLKVCPVANFHHDVTPRFIQTDSPMVERKRRRLMLMGAYYLCVKWRADSEADLYKNMLINENLILPNTELNMPSKLIPRVIAKEVADFSHGLRFAPSRFWQ
jgi:GT2 family glycosyltransferase